MKTLRILFCAAAFIAAVSCNKEVQEPQVKEDPEVAKTELIPMTFTATTTDTKTSLDGLNIKWLSTDKISVFDGAGANNCFETTGTGTTVKFTGNVTQTSENYLALYPYDENASQQGAFIVKTTLAANQEATTDNFADGININAAMSADNTTFHFYNVLSIGKFTLDASNLGGKEIKSVKFASADHPLAGDVAINYSPEGITASAGDNTVKEITLAKADGSALADGAYYFTVLPNEGGAITMTFESVDGYTAQISTNLGKAFVAGVVKNLGTVRGLTWGETITKGAPYTLEQNTSHAFTSLTGDGSQLVVNSMTWSIAKVSGAENAGIQSNISGRGLQVGSSNNGVNTVTVTGRDYDVYAKAQEGGTNAYGIKDIEVMVCAAEGNEVTVGVTVGGTAMSSSDATHTITGVTVNAVETSHFTSDELLFGDIVITYTLKDQGALYVNDIMINPTPTLANPVVTATSEVSSVTVSWEAIAGAESYDVLLDGDTDYTQEGVTGTSYTFENVADGTYSVSVTAKATGYNSGVGTATVKVKKNPDNYILVEEAGAFVDGGKYVLVLRDGTANGHDYFFVSGMTTSTNTVKDALTISNGKIVEPDEKYIFTATSSNGGFTLKGSDNKYIYNSGSNTSVSSGNSCVWVPTYLSASKAYKLSLGSTSGRFLCSGDANGTLKAYASSNTFIDQLAEGIAIGTSCGAISVFKLGGLSVDPAIIDATVDNLSARAGSHNITINTKGTESKVKFVSKQGNLFASDPTMQEDGYTLSISLKDNYTGEVQQGTITVALVDDESVTGTMTIKQNAAEFRVSSDNLTLACLSGSTAQVRVYSDFDWEIVNNNAGYTVSPGSYVYDGSSYKILTITAAGTNSQASTVSLGSFTVKRDDDATLAVSVNQESAVVPNPATVDVINGNASFSASWTPAKHATGYVAYLHTSQTSTPATGGQGLTVTTEDGKYIVSATNLENDAKYYLYVKVSSVDDGYVVPSDYTDAIEVAPVASTPVPDDQTITFSELYSANTNLNGVSINGDNFTVVFAKGDGSNAPQYFTNGAAVRAYAKNTITVTAKDAHKIASIVLTFGTGGDSNTITTDSETYSNGTWTGTEGKSSVVFTIGGTSGNRRIAAVTVTYSE